MLMNQKVPFHGFRHFIHETFIIFPIFVQNHSLNKLILIAQVPYNWFVRSSACKHIAIPNGVLQRLPHRKTVFIVDAISLRLNLLYLTHDALCFS